MHYLLAMVSVLVFVAGAQATPSPFAAPKVLDADTAIIAEPVGAMLEANYFRAPPPPTYSPVRLFPCRLRLHVATQTHKVVQSCE
jgi:hypothetical protein